MCSNRTTYAILLFNFSSSSFILVRQNNFLPTRVVKNIARHKKTRPTELKHIYVHIKIIHLSNLFWFFFYNVYPYVTSKRPAFKFPWKQKMELNQIYHGKYYILWNPFRWPPDLIARFISGFGWTRVERCYFTQNKQRQSFLILREIRFFFTFVCL